MRLEDSWHDFYKSEIMAQPVQGLGESRLQALPSLLQKNAAWLVEDRQSLGTPGSAPSSPASPVKRRVWAGFVHGVAGNRCHDGGGWGEVGGVKAGAAGPLT